MKLIRLFVVSIFVLLLTTGSSSISENPDKDKLLIEVITYVLQGGHYDPKDINDTFLAPLERNGVLWVVFY